VGHRLYRDRLADGVGGGVVECGVAPPIWLPYVEVSDIGAGDFLDYVPLAAAASAIPQFLPQVVKLQGTDDSTGVSWSWAALTSLNNAAWIGYFALSGFWTALVPASSATILAGLLATMLALRGRATRRSAALIGAWAAVLVAGYTFAGRTGLGTLLTAAFILQVTPSIATAYRTKRPTGLSRGTWMLIFGELSCWTAFGLHKSDPRLITLGITGVAASALMVARIQRTNAIERRAATHFVTAMDPRIRRHMTRRTKCESSS
jgi:hypothetical protein